MPGREGGRGGIFYFRSMPDPQLVPFSFSSSPPFLPPSEKGAQIYTDTVMEKPKKYNKADPNASYSGWDSMKTLEKQ